VRSLPVHSGSGHRQRFLLGLLLTIATLSQADGQRTGPAHKDAPLPAPLEALTRSFRMGRPGLLRELLRESGKIRASSQTLGMKSGYYSPDQVYFLFQDVFRIHRTLKFHIVRGADIPPHCERQTVVARWIYRRGNSKELTAELSFELVHREGSWSIQEIREIL